MASGVPMVAWGDLRRRRRPAVPKMPQMRQQLLRLEPGWKTPGTRLPLQLHGLVANERTAKQLRTLRCTVFARVANTNVNLKYRSRSRSSCNSTHLVRLRVLLQRGVAEHRGEAPADLLPLVRLGHDVVQARGRLWGLVAVVRGEAVVVALVPQLADGSAASGRGRHPKRQSGRRMARLLQILQRRRLAPIAAVVGCSSGDHGGDPGADLLPGSLLTLQRLGALAGNHQQGVHTHAGDRTICLAVVYFVLHRSGY
mmetsp:Transcript_47986/g.126712  ORF Transcript_47986/g.126712 Transcript_47986/m.126712 type:complete len:255 (-) Transcript_47986:15-779(-)